MAVGIVLVSHSRKLAEGVAELAGQMTQGRVPIVPAGGTDDDGLGTSLARVQAALSAADVGQGCVVLFDLGSALMTTEFALESLPYDQATRVLLVAAPFVEGAIAAGVESAVGGDLQAVAAAARSAATQAKAPHGAPYSVVEPAADGAPREVARVLLLNRVGLHARPASLFVQTAARFGAQVSVQLGDREVDGKRILSILQLGARCGDELTLHAQGPDATAALAALTALVQRKFDEPE